MTGQTAAQARLTDAIEMLKCAGVALMLTHCATRHALTSALITLDDLQAPVGALAGKL